MKTLKEAQVKEGARGCSTGFQAEPRAHGAEVRTEASARHDDVREAAAQQVKGS